MFSYFHLLIVLSSINLNTTSSINIPITITIINPAKIPDGFANALCLYIYIPIPPTDPTAPNIISALIKARQALAHHILNPEIINGMVL